MNEDIFNLDGITEELRSSSEKIDAMTQEVLQEYFSIGNALHRRMNFDRSRIKADIANDYAYKINQEVSTLRETVDRLWEREKGLRELLGTTKAHESLNN